MTSITRALDLQEKEIVVTAGGGGKTSIINRLARESVRAGKKVIITTTTKIYPPPGCTVVLQQDTGGEFLKEIKALLHRDGIAASGQKINAGQKITGLSPASVDELFKIDGLDLLLVEGDGAKGRHFKAPRDFEPVIPGSATVVIPVVGAECIDKPLSKEYFYCLQQISMLTGLDYGDTVTAGAIAKVLLHRQGYKKDVPARARWIPFLNKIDLVKSQKVSVLARHLLKAGTEKVLAGTALHGDPVKKIYTHGAVSRAPGKEVFF